jgi:hypothetical protein
MRFDRGYISPYFITNPKNMKCELENPLVLLVEKKVSQLQALLPLLEAIVKTQRPLLIISEDVEGEVRAAPHTAQRRTLTATATATATARHSDGPSIQPASLLLQMTIPQFRQRHSSIRTPPHPRRAPDESRTLIRRCRQTTRGR